MKPWALWLLGSFLIGAGYPAAAQLHDGRTICLIEPLPELPGGGGVAAIAAAIGRRVVYPPPALRAGAEGRVFVRFTVTPAGHVRNVMVTKAFWHDCGQAAASAVQRLPRFRPRHGALGEVSYTVPVSFKIVADKPLKPRPAHKKIPAPHPVPRHAATAHSDNLKLICYFEPRLERLAGGGTRDIMAAVRQRLIYPLHAGLVCLTGRTFVKFTITPAGEVKQVEVVKGVWPPFDSAAVNAVRQLPCFKPQPSKAGDVSYTVPITYDIQRRIVQ